MGPGSYVARVGLAGAISCSVTHSLVVPLDNIKTCVQTGAESAAGAAVRIVREDGAIALLKGLRPTAVGYWLQGAAKFGGYEALKMLGRKVFWTRDGELHEPATLAARLPLMLGAAGIAEMGACLLLCPLETAKLRIQMGMGGAGLIGTLSCISQAEGFGALYRGFAPIALRQVPYTMVKLVCYDAIAGMIAQSIRRARGKEPDPHFVSLSAGLTAGSAAAIVSQPADVLLTRLCGTTATTQLVECVIASGLWQQIQYMRSMGLRQCYAGLGPRLAMIACVTAAQFALYDDVRHRLGISVSYK